MEVISTDHAPHSEEEKKRPIAKAPFGITGIETSFCIAYTELVLKGVLTLEQLVEKMSCNPARIAGIDRGTLLPGKTADIVVANLDEEYIIDRNDFVSKGKNTPFDGKKVRGIIEYTFVSGKEVYKRRKI